MNRMVVLAKRKSVLLKKKNRYTIDNERLIGDGLFSSIRYTPLKPKSRKSFSFKIINCLHIVRIMVNAS